MKTITKIAVISSLLATLMTTSCIKRDVPQKHHGPYDASKIGADALNKEKAVLKVEVSYSDPDYSKSTRGHRCYGILRPGHTYHIRGMIFEDYENKDLAELVLRDDLTLKVLPKEKGESGIFPVPEGADPACILTKESPLEELVWQYEAKIEHVGQEFLVKTIERNKDKYYEIKILGYRFGDVSVEKREWSPEGSIITKEYGSSEVKKVK